MRREIALDDRQHPVEVNGFVDARYSAHPLRLLVCCRTGTDDYDRDPRQPGSAERKRRNDSRSTAASSRSSRMRAGGELRTASRASKALLAVLTDMW